ncbi:MAG TPA: Single-stranded DNA binding protein [Methanosarcinaceae archaeon]|nr:Single-stranded DNA binding protein [Methanosarcinaceae archaeon]
MNNKLAPHIEELTKALENIDIGESQIGEELKKLLDFRVPLDEAKRTIIRKFRSTFMPIMKIKDITAGLKGFEVTGRIIDVTEKSVNLRSKETVIFSGTLADEDGACSFTAWNDNSLKSGEVIRIKNAYSRSWHNRSEVNFGQRSHIEKLPDDTLPSIDELCKTPAKKLRDVANTDLSVSSVAVILEYSHKNVTVKGENVTIIEGVVADETAKLPFTSWVSLDGLDIGSVIRFENASVRMFRGVPSLNFNENTIIGAVVSTEELPFTFESANMIPEPVAIGEIMVKDGMFDTVALGNIISIRPGSGIITRCPECNRVIQKNTCRVHGTVEGVKDMRIKAILDDGTGAVSVMLNRELSEIVYGRSMPEAEDIIQKAISQDAVFGDMRQVLTGKYLAVRGNTSSNEFGIMLVAKSAWFPDDNTNDRVSALMGRLGNNREGKRGEVYNG